MIYLSKCKSLDTSSERLSKIEVERLKNKITSIDKQQKQDISNLKKVYEAKEERLLTKLKQQRDEFKQRELEYSAQVSKMGFLTK